MGPTKKRKRQRRATTEEKWTLPFPTWLRSLVNRVSSVSAICSRSKKHIACIASKQKNGDTPVTHGWYYFRCIPVAAPGSIRMAAKGSEFDSAFCKTFPTHFKWFGAMKNKTGDATADRHYFPGDPPYGRFLPQARPVRHTHPILILTSFVFCSSVALCFALLFSRRIINRKGRWFNFILKKGLLNSTSFDLNNHIDWRGVEGGSAAAACRMIAIRSRLRPRALGGFWRHYLNVRVFAFSSASAAVCGVFLHAWPSLSLDLPCIFCLFFSLL